MNSSLSFRLQLLGRPSIKAEGGDLLKGAPAQRRRVALLALLALAQDRGVTRDKVLGYLWPENDIEHARNLLNVAVYALRKSLGEEAIVSDAEGLRLNTSIVGSDVADFEAAIASGDGEAVVALYCGPFLDGFFVGDAPEFERWVERERDRLGRLYSAAVEKLADESERDQNFDRAAKWWRSRAAYDPYDSRVTLRLMQALDASGNTAAALQQALIHERLLKEDFGVEPSADLKNAAVALRSRRETVDQTTFVRQQGRPQTPPGKHVAGASVDAASANADSHDVIDEKLEDAELPLSRSRRNVAVSIGSVLTIAAIGGGWFLSGRGKNDSKVSAPVVTAQPTRTMAVLPFINMSADSSEEYFSDGLTDELISALSQVRALRVASRTSAFAFKGQKRDIRSIGRVLNVGSVLEGSVRKVGNHVRVTAQLINSADGFHLWSETYDRQGTDIFAIQADMALRIASALEAKLTPQERNRIARPPTESAHAHTLYLQARYFAGQRRSESLAKAIEYYERAIAEDPQYAAAYAGLASVYPPLGVHGYISPWEGRTRMREPAMKAVALDPGLAQAHTALGGYLYAFEWNWRGAESELRRAIELDPTAAHGWYSVYLLAMHRYDEAIREARKGPEFAPQSAIEYAQFGYTLVLAGQARLALEALNTSIELDSGLANSHLNLAMAYEELGKRDQAFREYQKFATLVRRDIGERAYLGRALVLAGRNREAREILDSLKAEGAKTRVYTPQVALLFDAFGETDSALAWLEASARQRHPGFPHGVVEPAFASLRGNQRFRELLRRNGLP